MDQRSICEYCNGNGLVSIFHKNYRGDPTVWVDRCDEMGNIIKRRLPGVISAHCFCDKGRSMRDKTDEETRRRIPKLTTILEGKMPEYGLADPTEFDQPELTDGARSFIEKWRDEFDGNILKVAPSPIERNPDDVANEIRRQIQDRAKRITKEEPIF